MSRRVELSICQFSSHLEDWGNGCGGGVIITLEEVTREELYAAQLDFPANSVLAFRCQSFQSKGDQLGFTFLTNLSIWHRTN